MRDLVDLIAELVIIRVILSHTVDLCVQACFQFPVTVFHSVDILIRRWISCRDKAASCSLDECTAAGYARRDQQEEESSDADNQKNICMPEECFPDNSCCLCRKALLGPDNGFNGLFLLFCSGIHPALTLFLEKFPDRCLFVCFCFCSPSAFGSFLRPELQTSCPIPHPPGRSGSAM